MNDCDAIIAILDEIREIARVVDSVNPVPSDECHCEDCEWLNAPLTPEEQAAVDAADGDLQ